MVYGISAVSLRGRVDNSPYIARALHAGFLGTRVAEPFLSYRTAIRQGTGKGFDPEAAHHLKLDHLATFRIIIPQGEVLNEKSRAAYADKEEGGKILTDYFRMDNQSPAGKHQKFLGIKLRLGKRAIQRETEIGNFVELCFENRLWPLAAVAQLDKKADGHIVVPTFFYYLRWKGGQFNPRQLDEMSRYWKR